MFVLRASRTRTLPRAGQGGRAATAGATTRREKKYSLLLSFLPPRLGRRYVLLRPVPQKPPCAAEGYGVVVRTFDLARASRPLSLPRMLITSIRPDKKTSIRQKNFGDRFVCAPSVRRGSFVRLQFDEVKLCAFSSTRFFCAPSVR